MERKAIDLKHLPVTSVIAALLLFGCVTRPTASAAALQACTPGNIILDGGFETTDPDTAENANWAGTSTLFGTPLCTVDLCGADSTAGPRTGTFWAWFGGTAADTDAETATLAQTVIIPAGATSANLNFFLRIGSVSVPFSDTLKVKVDGVTQTTITEPGAAQASFTQRTVNLLSFANGAAHTIVFEYVHPAGNSLSAFNVDDVSLDIVCGAAPTAKDSVGLFTASTRVFNLRNTNDSGPADVTFGYGAAGDIPITGDWDGDGDDTPGVYRPSTGTFFLRNSNTPGPAEISAQFGAISPNLVPLAGDWDGDGDDTIGLFDRSNGAFLLRNANSAGGADFLFTFGGGGSGVTPITGDWDNNGTDTIGFYVTATGAFFIRNANSTGPASTIITFGNGGGGLIPITGDWDNNGTDGIGLYVPTTGAFFLKNTITFGGADLVFVYGAGNQTPLAGDWDNLP